MNGVDDVNVGVASAVNDVSVGVAGMFFPLPCLLLVTGALMCDRSCQHVQLIGASIER